MSQTNAQLLADSLGTASTGTVPIGGIILWSGSVASIPGGYALCNGSNGTPNLQDRFVVGAGSGYAVAATGGSANAAVISHTHGVSHTHGPGNLSGYTNDPGNHTHPLGITIANTAASGNGVNRNGNSNPFQQNVGTGLGGAHNHSVFINGGSTAASSISSTGAATDGVAGSNANLPPYYALAYIMRTS